MTGKERMAMTLRFEEPDRPPHFETMFELEQEAFGLSFPDRRVWQSCVGAERERLIGGCMEIYQRIVERYQWDALAVYWPWSDPAGVRAAKQTFGESIMIGSIVGNVVHSIENIRDWEQFALDLEEEPEKLHAQARQKVAQANETCCKLIDAGADFILLVNDVAFNGGPYLSPAQFSALVTPYLAQTVRLIRDRGAYAFIHSDGNMMQVFDQWLSVGAHLYQSVDPMAGMDIAQVKRLSYGKMALMGNVQCNLLQEGPDEAIRASARYCLENAAPGGGYVFSTSNTIFSGMPLKNYEYMLGVYHEFCAVNAG